MFSKDSGVNVSFTGTRERVVNPMRIIRRHQIRFYALLPALLVAWVMVAPVAEAAGHLRCDTDLVRKGQALFEVLERCGEPGFEYSRVDYRYPGYLVNIDEWVYDVGKNKFRRLLTFENGRLVDIELRSKPRRRLSALRSYRN